MKVKLSFQTLKILLNASFKLAVIWIINPKELLHSEPNIGFDVFYFSDFLF